jgi:hypothetical protein
MLPLRQASTMICSGTVASDAHMGREGVLVLLLPLLLLLLLLFAVLLVVVVMVLVVVVVLMVLLAAVAPRCPAISSFVIA